jgi:hypothetical protein
VAGDLALDAAYHDDVEPVETREHDREALISSQAWQFRHVDG